jgi:transposase InsO family protein
MGITEVLTAPRSPWQLPYVERVIGSIRREYLDHVIVLNESHLRRILASYLDYYHRYRCHLSLDKDARLADGLCSRSAAARSWRFRKSAGSITATSGSRPESALAYGHGYC